MHEHNLVSALLNKGGKMRWAKACLTCPYARYMTGVEYEEHKDDTAAYMEGKWDDEEWYAERRRSLS